MRDFTVQQARSLVPLSIVKEIPLFSPAGSNALDVGVGTGRNAIFLARKGYRVDVVDSSSHAIDEINEYRRTYLLPMRASVLDICESDPPFSEYDIVLCTLVLHYLTPSRAELFLANARSSAPLGTLHVIAVITDEGDFSRDRSPLQWYLPNVRGLERTYLREGWLIHRAYEEHLMMLQTHPDGRPMSNLVAFVIAQKECLELNPR